jgi:hypothetical protein
MGQRIANGWAITKESYQVLKTTPNLAFFPIISGIACIIATISFMLPLVLTQHLQDHRPEFGVAHYVVMFLFYFVTSFIVIFFNSALVSCAYDALNGKTTSYKEGLQNATRHTGAILVWSLISATIGTVLRMISERAGLVGRLIISLLGAAWSIVTYFVIPIMILENGAPVPAVKRSFAMIKTSWGERIVGGVTIGLIFGLLSLLGIIPIVVAIIAAANGAWLLSIPLIALALFYFLGLSVISATLSGIFNTAVYIFASTGRIPDGFSEEFVRMAFVQKQNRMWGRQS